jgi:phytoene desaturase
VADALRYDALVIGAGAGGLCAAARLAHVGYRTLLVESRDRVGGRASSEEIDGFIVNTGAIAIECGGVLEDTFRQVEAPFDIRVPEPASLFRLGGREVQLQGQPTGRVINGLLKSGAHLLRDAGEDDRTPLAAWLSRHTRNEMVHAIFRNLCAAIFAVNSDELPARVFMTYFHEKGAARSFGFSPTGTLGLMQKLADAVERDGGEIWLASSVEALAVEGHCVAMARIARREGGTVEIEPEIVISNAGPLATVTLCGEEHVDRVYVDRMERDLRPSANIVVNISSREPLLEAPGTITFGVTRRLCSMVNLTATCPELASEGWHLYAAYGVPKPAIGEFDEKAEVEATLADLRDEFERFDERARILSVRVMRGDWPAQRSIAGYDLPRETPIENLWNVGDGVRTYGNGGVQACAETAKLVVEEVLERYGVAAI